MAISYAKVFLTSAACLALAYPGQRAFGQASETLNLTTEQWRDDLRFLARELPKRHAEAFHSCPKAQFDAAVADLDSRLSNLNSDQIWVGMERIVSLVGDAHTYIRFPSDCPDLPLVIDRFGDEYRVTRVAKGLEKALGAKVLLIGDTPVQKARELMRPLAPQDLYENRKEALVAIDFTIGCLLHGVGITNDSNAARYTLGGDDGERFTVEAKAPPLHERPVEWIWPFQELPLFRQNPDRSFWQVFLPESRTSYCNVRSVRNLRALGRSWRRFLSCRFLTNWLSICGKAPAATILKA